MDLVLNICDNYLLTPYIYPPNFLPYNLWRQIISLTFIVNLGAILLYISTATISYFFIFDKSLMKHPLFLKNQVYLEISYALGSIPFMSVPTIVIFLFEVRGYSKLYDDFSESQFGYFSIMFETVTFILFTDCFIYWIHRWLHIPWIYRRFHKQHHLYKITTPFASHAFHPLDGFSQSLPYHIYPFLFPLNKLTYLGLFVAVNIWTISIHDGAYGVPTWLKPFVNGSAHHTDHHMYYRYNYGQFFTLWDRIGGSFRTPTSFLGNGPADYVKRQMEKALSLDKNTENSPESTHETNNILLNGHSHHTSERNGSLGLRARKHVIENNGFIHFKT